MTDELYAQAITTLDDKLKSVSDKERHEVLFKRATAHKMMENYGAARDDFRAAMKIPRSSPLNSIRAL